MKNNLCLFERPFKIQKNGVFLFKISFFVLEILTFFYYANLISDDVILFATNKWKILNRRYLWKYWSSVLEISHHKCTSPKKQNDTLSAVSIATLLAPVSFCQKPKIPICNLYGGTKGPTWNRNSSHIVFSPIIRLGGVDSSCFKAKSGITVFINTAPVAKLLSWQQH